MKRPTISDVARLCGLSKTTVSVILNETPAASRVPAETHQRVKQAADQLGYRPSWRARALTQRLTHTIGVLYAPPMPLVVRGNYEGIMAGINETLTTHRYHVMFVPLGEDPGEWGDMLMDQRMDGCLVLSRLYDALSTLLQRSHMPVTLVNADTELPLPVVIADDFQGSRDLTKHLLDLGHRRVTFFLGDQPPHYSVEGRIGGYQQAMKDAGLDPYASVVRGSAADLVATVARMRDGGESGGDRLTAVITYTHHAAISMLRLLWEAGLSVPKDLSVATFSNSYPVAEVIPPLTVMALPTEDMGRTAAEMVLEQIQTSGAAPPRRMVLKETLIVRKSTAPPGKSLAHAPLTRTNESEIPPSRETDR
ncbi:MAG: LacI family transcriptional regulator [Planctomycetota bacterium]|nr:LacI family transcriptional regulator [Planctomycetota bacterium]